MPGIDLLSDIESHYVSAALRFGLITAPAPACNAGFVVWATLPVAMENSFPRSVRVGASMWCRKRSDQKFPKTGLLAKHLHLAPSAQVI
jgi:hypothetical protein